MKKCLECESYLQPGEECCSNCGSPAHQKFIDLCIRDPYRDINILVLAGILAALVGLSLLTMPEFNQGTDPQLEKLFGSLLFVAQITIWGGIVLTLIPLIISLLSYKRKIK